MGRPSIPRGAICLPAAARRRATFDPTLLENGTYTIRLRSLTTGGEAIADTTVSVDGEMKVGLFSLSYVDMEVGLGKLPIQILRNYDNRRVGKVGDFGADWELATQAVRVERAGKLGKYWGAHAGGLGLFPGVLHRTAEVFTSDDHVARRKAVPLPPAA